MVINVLTLQIKRSCMGLELDSLVDVNCYLADQFLIAIKSATSISSVMRT